MPMRTIAWMLAAVAVVAGAAHVRGQTPQDQTAEAADEELTEETNPTRPVLFSIRPELYNPSSTVTQASLIFRYDQAMLRARRWLPGKRAVILRFEVPIAETHVVGTTRQAGLGDIYGQILLVPHLTTTGAFVVGTGLIVPSASNDWLGAGKWVLAPAAGPAWFFGGRGMLFIKFQNFVSVAGNSYRPDVNFLLITPIFVHTVVRRWWVLADSETKTNWLKNARTGVKSGVQVGRHVSGGFGAWVKPEWWWGPNQDGQWNLKFGVVWYR
jgi:hypothetical protein